MTGHSPNYDKLLFGKFLRKSEIEPQPTEYTGFYINKYKYMCI